MNQEEQKKLEQYFYYGIDKPGKIKIVKAFVYFAFQEAKKCWRKEKPKDIEFEEYITQKLKDISVRRYRQFYRFVLLNDRPDAPDYETENQVMDPELENKIKQKMEFVIDQLRKAKTLNIWPKRAKYVKDYVKVLFEEEKCGYMNLWTHEVYQLTKQLEQLEQQDPEAYRKKWLETKLARAKDRKNRQQQISANSEKEDEEVK